MPCIGTSAGYPLSGGPITAGEPVHTPVLEIGHVCRGIPLREDDGRRRVFGDCSRNAGRVEKRVEIELADGLKSFQPG